jgi:hypothetical protein
LGRLSEMIRTLRPASGTTAFARPGILTFMTAEA